MIKKYLRSPIATLVLFVLGAGLLLFGGIGGIQAAPRIQSEYFGGQVQLTEIHTAIAENHEVVEGEMTLLNDHFFGANENLNSAQDFKLGTKYKEELSVVNIGSDDPDYEGGEAIDQYVRVRVYCYWVRVNENGSESKLVNLDPSKINLEFVEGNGWTIDRAASNYDANASEKPVNERGERTVLYYRDILPVGEETTPFTATISVDPDVLDQTHNGKSPYAGAEFRIKAVVDAVQTHNEDEARMGAWGQISANG